MGVQGFGIVVLLPGVRRRREAECLGVEVEEAVDHPLVAQYHLRPASQHLLAGVGRARFGADGGRAPIRRQGGEGRAGQEQDQPRGNERLVVFALPER